METNWLTIEFVKRKMRSTGFPGGLLNIDDRQRCCVNLNSHRNESFVFWLFFSKSEVQNCYRSAAWNLFSFGMKSLRCSWFARNYSSYNTIHAQRAATDGIFTANILTIDKWFPTFKAFDLLWFLASLLMSVWSAGITS